MQVKMVKNYLEGPYTSLYIDSIVERVEYEWRHARMMILFETNRWRSTAQSQEIFLVKLLEFCVLYNGTEVDRLAQRREQRSGRRDGWSRGAVGP